MSIPDDLERYPDNIGELLHGILTPPQGATTYTFALPEDPYEDDEDAWADEDEGSA